MCIRYICTSCQTLTVHHCESADLNQVNPACTLPTIDPHPPTIHKRCFPCKTIEGAITKMNQLIFQQPWLATEGVSGAENLEDWEREQEMDENKATMKRIDWDEAGDEELWDRLKNMGLQELEGKEALNDGHGIIEASTSEKTDWTQGQKSGSDASQMQRSFWDSEEGTLATDEPEGSKLKSAGSVSFDTEQGQEPGQLVGVGELFE